MRRIKRWWNKLLIWLGIRKQALHAELNILREVRTYQEANLAFLQNLCAHIAASNSRYKDFDDIESYEKNGVIMFKPKEAE